MMPVDIDDEEILITPLRRLRARMGEQSARVEFFRGQIAIIDRIHRHRFLRRCADLARARLPILAPPYTGVSMVEAAAGLAIGWSPVMRPSMSLRRNAITDFPPKAMLPPACRDRLSTFRSCRHRPNAAKWTVMRIFERYLLALLLCLAACSSLPPPLALPSQPSASALSEVPIFTQLGIASWYGKSNDGMVTANGEQFDMQAMTAAHRTLAFDTIVRVTNTVTGRMVKVRINDRGPYAKRRIIDLSAAAAAASGIHEDGVVPVRVEVFAMDQPPS
jgi:hypothetical protein